MSYFYMKKFYDPQIKALESAAKELTKVSAELNSLQDLEPAFKLQGQIEKLKKELAELDAAVSGLTNRSGSTNDLTAMQQRVQHSALQTGVVIVSVTPKGGVEDFFRWNAYQVEMVAAYGNFIAFLDELRKYPDPVKTGSIEMAREGQRKGILRVKMELQI